MPKALTQDQIDHYHREGYLSPVRIISAEEAARCRQRLEDIERSMGGRFKGPGRTKFYLRYRWAWELATNKVMLDIAEDLLGPDILLYHNTSWLKQEADQAYVSWHQDNIYIGMDPCELLTFWIALTPSAEENGCMQVLPGTHKMGQLPLGEPDLRDSNMLPSGAISAFDYASVEPVSMPLAPGEASIHHGFTLHGSLPNVADQRRMGVTFLYIPAHVGQKGSRRTSAMLVRGEDRYGNFEPETPPISDDDPDAVARQERSAALYRGKEDELGKKTITRFD